MPKRRMMRAVWTGLLSLGFSIALGARQPLPPEGTPISTVEVVGAMRTSASRVLGVMELREGGAFSAESLRRDQQAIADLGFYNPLTLRIESAEAEGGAIKLVVTVEENPVIRRIAIVGNVAYKAERLRREIDLKEGDLLPLAARSRTSRSLQKFYAGGGYKTTGVSVAIQPVDGMENTVDVDITVDEGEKIKIKDLLIEGNTHFSDFALRMAVVNSGSWLFFPNYYDERAFEDDLRTVEAKYRDAGFLDVVAKRGEFKYDENKAEVSPVIVITEGPRYRVTSTTVKGHTLFNDAELQAPFEGLIGKTFDGGRFREAVEKVRTLYGDQGYVNAEINASFERDPQAGTVVLALTITENDVIYVGKVLVQKQDYDYEFDLNPLEQFVDWRSPGVKEETVRREVKLVPGQKYRTADEVRTRQRLRGLGFFRKVNVRREPTSDPAVNDVVVEVEEDPAAGYVGVTAGVGERSGPSVGVNYTNPNLFGEARVLKANAIVGRRTSYFSVGYLDRHFKDTDRSLDVDFYRDYETYRGYAQRTYGTSTEYGVPFSEYVKGYARVRLENVNLKRRSDDLAEPMGSYNVAAVRGLVVKDLRDDLRWTTSGYVVNAGLEVGYADGPLVKLTHSLDWYRSLSKDQDWVYHYGHKVGLMPYDADEVGISERFFMGGTSSLRGFAPRGAGPKDEGDKRVVVGGSTLLTQRHELRHRFNDYLAGRVFVDAGILEEGFLEFGTPRVGSGVGTTFDMGAVSLDIDLAAALVRQSRDRTRAFHFRLRSNF